MNLVFQSSLVLATVLSASLAFAADVKLKPDGNGNLKPVGRKGSKIRVVKGDKLRFQKLSSRDLIVEVKSKSLTNQEMNDLCGSAELPAKVRHKVPAQDPLPSGLYPKKEISGPYHTYPAGIVVMSPGSDECNVVQVQTANPGCPSPMNLVASYDPPGGGAGFRLCETTDSSDPPCEKGKVMHQIWTNPAVQGVFLRIDWRDVNPAYGVYEWGAVKESFSQAVRYGKTILIGIRTGGKSIPAWVFDSGDAQGNHRARRVVLKDWGSGDSGDPPPSCGNEFIVASPSDDAYLLHFSNLIDELGRMIREDQRRFSVLAGVKVTGMGQQTLENRLPKRCNIAVPDPTAGPNQYRLIDPKSAADDIQFIEEYRSFPINDPEKCICNPSALSAAGYTPSELYSFYSAVARKLQANFGHKQKTYMNLSSGFPLINDNGRFYGDHLPHYIFDPEAPYNENALQLPPRITPAVRPASVSAEVMPKGEDQTAQIIKNGANPRNFGGNRKAPFGWGVENAALGPLPLASLGRKCAQQANIQRAAASVFAGNPEFPIPGGRAVISDLPGCPNELAAREGIDGGKVTGFQVQNDIANAAELDSALWNLTLNSNATFVELYQKDVWRATHETNNGSAPLDPVPVVAEIIPQDTREQTLNANLASPKTLKQWNELLLLRARVFSSKSKSPFLKDPHPTEYVVDVPGGSTSRYIVNTGACRAFEDRGVPLKVTKITFN